MLHARCVQRQVPVVDDVAQFIESHGRPCYHAETVATVEVSHIQFIAGAGGHFRSQQRVGMVAALR